MELLWHIQHAPDTDAQAMFDRLREGHDPSAILAAAKPLDTGAQNDQSEKSATLTHPRAPQRRMQQHADSTVLNEHTRVPDLSDPAPLAVILQSQGGILAEAFSIFLKCTATIFHVYTQQEVDTLLTETLNTDKEVPLSTLCAACGIAAVGSRFSRAKISPEMGEYYFNVTKQLLDECIEKTPLQALKVCALLAMCNIINKATAALAYVGQCINSQAITEALLNPP